MCAREAVCYDSCLSTESLSLNICCLSLLGCLEIVIVMYIQVILVRIKESTESSLSASVMK